MKQLTSWMFALAMLWSASAFAITIDARAAPYNNVAAANGVGIGSIFDVRVGAQTALVGAYRSVHGIASVPNLAEIEFIYHDGTREKGKVECAIGTYCVQPIPGTQEGGEGGGDGGGGDGGGSGGGGGGWGGGGPGGGGGGGGGGGCSIVINGVRVVCEVG